MQQRHVQRARYVPGFELGLTADIDVNVAVGEQRGGFLGRDASDCHALAVTPAGAFCKEEPKEVWRPLNSKAMVQPPSNSISLDGAAWREHQSVEPRASVWPNTLTRRSS